MFLRIVYCRVMGTVASAQRHFQLHTPNQVTSWAPDQDIISPNVLVNEFQKVDSPTKPSTHCSLLLGSNDTSSGSTNTLARAISGGKDAGEESLVPSLLLLLLLLLLLYYSRA